MNVDIGAASLVYTVWLVDSLACLNFDIQVLSFDLQLVRDQGQSRESPSMRARILTTKKNNQKNQHKHTSRNLANNNMSPTVATGDGQCRYQYPNQRLVELILSNMTNELVAVFVNADKWLKAKVFKKTETMSSVDKILQALFVRINDTHHKRSVLLKKAYSIIMKEYRLFYNATTERVLRSGYNACKHQQEVNELWHDFLELCLATVKITVGHCLSDYVGGHGITPESPLGRRVQAHLLQEMNAIKTVQLQSLCHNYNICYDEKLNEFRHPPT